MRSLASPSPPLPSASIVGIFLCSFHSLILLLVYKEIFFKSDPGIHDMNREHSAVPCLTLLNSRLTSKEDEINSINSLVSKQATSLGSFLPLKVR